MAENEAVFTIRDVDSTDEAQDIKEELEDLEGVMGVAVDQTGRAEVRFDYDLISEESVKNQVREYGYEIE